MLRFSAAVRQRRALSTTAAMQKKHELFDRILIANRGEIALRVMRTCKRLGIETVAVHSDVDANAEHTKAATMKHCIGPAQSIHSYLNIDRLVEACKATGAQAVHPGYGFLSEKSAFAKALEENGIVFIGPKPHALKVMGDKLESKQIALDANVNTIPGFRGVIRDADHAVEISQQVGYPVMIKAAAGGGGKGMRLAWNDDEARDGFRFSQNEARSCFNDERLLIEKFIEHPRHIEIQLLADSFGNTIYLNERECSIQRRNQKVVEEAPSVFLDPATRSAMGEQACMLAKAVQYQSAGTVEFLVDRHRKFYFLEMNTRLQVEHAISEKITGVDIVEHMIRVAAGQKLALKQSDIGINGWAFESRVYAEDPYRFLPSTGRLTTYQDPGWVDPDVRVDSAVIEGSDISMYYDPMICKLVTHGKTRADALNLMIKSLDNYVIKGVNHNIPLLRDILVQPQFVSGDLSTNFIPETYPDGFKGFLPGAAETEQLVACAAVMAAKRAVSMQPQGQNFQIPEFAVTVGKRTFTAAVSQSASGFQASVNGAPAVAVDTAWQLHETLFHAAFGADKLPLTVQHILRDGQLLRVRFHGTEFDVTIRTAQEQALAALMPPKKVEDTSSKVLSPMPGTIISVNVRAGSQVAAGAELAVIEAMKMQNKLLAPRAGTIKTVLAQVGGTVDGDQLIVEFEPEQAKA